MGDRGAELRVRPVVRGQLQEADQDRYPDAEIVGEQYPALGKIDAGATVAALENTNPTASSTRCSAPTSRCSCARAPRAAVRETHGGKSAHRRARVHHPAGRGDAGGLVHNRLSVGADCDAKHKAFVDAYRAKFNDTPRLGLLGYVVGYMMKDLLDKAGSTDTDKLLAALDDLKSDTIAGPVVMRAPDHQSTLAPGSVRRRARARWAP